MDKPAGKPVVGGQCKYKKYSGQAKIISIRKKELPNNYGGPSYENYEVKFSFLKTKSERILHVKCLWFLFNWGVR